MEFFSSMKKWPIIHLLLVYVFLVSGLIVNFLMLCSVVFWPISKNLYRKMNYHLAYFHWCQVTALATWWSNTDCVLYCDPEDKKKIGKEHSLYVLNHGYEIDFVMLWILAERLQMLGGAKIFGKEALKFVPVIGFAWYFTESIFLKRNWVKDKKILEDNIREITTFPPNIAVAMLLFPEGTRFTPEKHQASLEVCRQKGYHEMKHLLLPRPKGFYMSVLGMKGKIPSLMDGTVAFPVDKPEPTLWNIIRGESVLGHLKIRRILIDDVPTETEKVNSDWLRQLFVEKDNSLDYFRKNGCFDGTTHRIPRRPNDLIMWIFWIVITSLPLFHYSLKIFLSGTITQQLTFICVVVLGSFLGRKLIGLTQISKGSKYGMQAVNGKKKTK